MRYLLDTNVISELRKLGDKRADPRVTAWFANVPSGECAISVITLMELEIGILRIERRDDQQGRALRRWLNDFVLPTFDGQIIPIAAEVAFRCAALHVPDPPSERDALIAATAMVHGLTVVTRNVRDFTFAGLDIFNPWLG